MEKQLIIEGNLYKQDCRYEIADIARDAIINGKSVVFDDIMKTQSMFPDEPQRERVLGIMLSDCFYQRLEDNGKIWLMQRWDMNNDAISNPGESFYAITAMKWGKLHIFLGGVWIRCKNLKYHPVIIKED